VRAIADFAVSKARQQIERKPITTMEDAYVAQFGRTLYELFFRRYSEKVWGDACSSLSGDWVAQRSRNLSLLTAVRDALKLTDGKVESLVDRFMYPALGFGRISERLAEAIEGHGGQVHLGQRVVRADHDGVVINRVTVSDGSREQAVDGDVFISSIPMTELAQVLRPAADPAIVAAAQQLTYRDLITVHLMLDRPSVTKDTWVYVHDPRVSFARLHEPRNWSPALAPADKTSLVLEFFCDAGDGMWQRSDQEICDLAIHDLVEYLHFIEPRDVLDAFAVRSRDAYPRYSLGYSQAVDAIKAHLRSFRNLEIVGRGGTFRYSNTDHAIETGLLAAAEILGDTVDIDGVNSSREYLEERRVSTGEGHAPISVNGAGSNPARPTSP
jgi:protoporphyrinogen oxidase